MFGFHPWELGSHMLQGRKKQQQQQQNMKQKQYFSKFNKDF